MKERRAGDITPVTGAIASANSRPGPASSPAQVWLQEERGGGHRSRRLPRAWQASSSLPSSTSLKFTSLVFKRKGDSLLCFQTGFRGANGPDPLCQCYCVRIQSAGQEAIRGHRK